jgi:hypothetical protein
VGPGRHQVGRRGCQGRAGLATGTEAVVGHGRSVGREGVGVGVKFSQTSVMAWYIHRLTDECTVLSSSVQTILLSDVSRNIIQLYRGTT